MPKVSIEKSTSSSAKDTFGKIKSFFENDADIKKIDASDVAVTSQGTGSTVKITVDLPFLLTPLKGKIQEMIEKKIGKYLA
jgi:hypothetical protein